MAYLREDGPLIQQSVRNIEYFDTYPYSRVWYTSEPTTTPAYTLVKGNTTVKRPKPTDITTSVTAHISFKLFETKATFTSRDGPFGVSSYQATVFRQPSSEIERLKTLASDALRAKIRDEKFDLPTFVAEMPQTLKWLNGAAKEMLDAYNFVKKGKWVNYLPKNAPKGKPKRKRVTKKVFAFTRRDGSVYSFKLAADRKLANRYLEWRFAVEPLVRDAESILDEYYASGAKPKYQRVASFVAETKVDSTQLWQKRESTVIVRAGCWMQISSNAASNAFRYGLNPLVTLWNLTPYSFMIDVWLPIGKTLGNLATDLGVSYRSNWTSSLERSSSQTTPPNSSMVNHGLSITQLEEYTRYPGLPALEFPSFRSARNLLKSSMDALALTRQRLTSFHRSY